MDRKKIEQPRDLNPQEAATSPLIRRLRSLDDFKPDAKAIDNALYGATADDSEYRE